MIAGAFIGPGTVTTCARAGASFGLALLWALVFSTVACLLLQEAAARLTVVTGSDSRRAPERASRAGAAGLALTVTVVGAMVLGCAAYEAGNVIGAVAGAGGALGLSAPWLALLIGLAAALLLAFGTLKAITRVFGGLVALMGVAFLITAVGLQPGLGQLLAGALMPSLPPGSAMVVLGLVGTTVVPYNLFLGSGLARANDLPTCASGSRCR